MRDRPDCSNSSCIITLHGESGTCCCTGELCNSIYGLTPAIEGSQNPCTLAGCNSDSCMLLDTGELRCFCQRGYELIGNRTCVDLNECLPGLQMHNCQSPAVCVNSNGSFRCSCPLGYKLSEDGTECLDAGLVCPSQVCTQQGCTARELEYCSDTLAAAGFMPRDLDRIDQYCFSSYIKGSDNILRPDIQSCLFVLDSALLAQVCTPNVCLLRQLEGTVYYQCCCTGIGCNDNVIFPSDAQLNSTTSLLYSMVSPTSSFFSHSAKTSHSLTLLILPTSHATVVRVTVDIRDNASQPDKHGRQQTADIATFTSVSGAFLLFVTIVISCVTCLVCVVRRRRSRQPRPTVELELVAISQLCLLDRIGQGRFGSVWRATIGAEPSQDIVAAKVFHHHHAESFKHELSIFSIPQLQHPNIVRFIGSRTEAATLTLVLAYHQTGNLQSLLQRQTLSVMECLRMIQGVAAGVAHLHRDIIQDGVTIKPAIAHRDIKSCNVLVMSSGTCCITDLGMAIRLDSIETVRRHVLVGTPRYQSPEGLQGAIDFQRESYKRSDVYSLAIVIWESVSRTDIPGAPVQDYRLPYHEAGPSPTVNEMKVIVVDEGQRPTIPASFTSYSDLEDLVVTIREAWDEDYLGRPNASLIVERLQALIEKLDSEC